MDDKLAMAIRSLDTKIVDYEMADILTKEERKALINRINGVKKFIDKRLVFEAKNPAVESIFVRFREQKDEEKAWIDAMESYGKKLKNPNILRWFDNSPQKYREFTTYFWDSKIATNIHVNQK